MKTLIKKSLLVLMVVFIAVFTLGVSSKVKAASDTYKLVKDVNDLAIDDEVIIVAAKENYAMSTAQNSNNRGSVAVTKNGEEVTFTTAVQVLTVKAGKTAGTFAFYTGSKGYLYAASSSKNYLRSETTLTDNSSWNVTISSAGVATIKSSGSYTRNWMRFNTSNNPKIFSCYGSGQTDISIYKKVVNAAEPSVNITGGTYTEIEDVVSLEVELANITGDVVWSSSNNEVATVDQDGNITAISMGKTTITANVDGVEDSIEFIVYPADGSELSIADAIKVCQYTGTDNCPFVYSTTGVIKSIDEAYSSQYNNIEVTITDGESSIKAYRMKNGSDLEVGDKITVTGTLVNFYGNTPEFVAGCTYELDPTTAIQKSVNKVNAYMSFAYKYTREDVEKTDETTGEVTIENLFTDVDFRIKCGVDKALADIEGVESYGIKVSTADKEMELAATGDDETCLFAVISLGDALTNAERLNVVFTVQAYIVVDGVTYTSKLTKSFSIAQMVEAYYNNAETSDKVVTLYELIQNL